MLYVVRCVVCSIVASSYAMHFYHDCLPYVYIQATQALFREGRVQGFVEFALLHGQGALSVKLVVQFGLACWWGRALAGGMRLEVGLCHSLPAA